MELRPPMLEELPALSTLCMRSKAHWGYDAAFMDACAEELTLTAKDLAEGHIIVAVTGTTHLGVAHVLTGGETAVIDKLFIDPDHIGSGVGRALFQWARDVAVDSGASTLAIDSDPYAESFYRKMGAETVKRVPSESIEGRTLPHMVCPL